MPTRILSKRNLFTSVALSMLLVLVTACGGQTVQTVKVPVTVEVPVTVQVPVTVEVPVKEEAPSEATSPAEAPTAEVTSPEEPPTAEPSVRNRILLYGVRSLYPRTDTVYFQDAHFTKFAALAFTKGLKLSCFEARDFINELQAPDVAAAIIIGSKSSEVLVALDSFVRNGGTALILYHAGLVEHNDLLQTLFGVSVVTERVADVEDVLVAPPPTLPPALRGYQVGVVWDGWDLSINAYLVSNRAGAEEGMLTSGDSGKDRLVYHSTGKTIFMPSIINYQVNSGSHFTPFFGDLQYDYFENEQAAEALLDFLMGLSE